MSSFNKDNSNLFSLRDKVIVITGASGLLGEMHAEAIASHGGTPILLDLDIDKLEILESNLNKKYNVESKGYQIDITNESRLSQLALEIFKKFKKIDGLINNAANNPKMETMEKVNFSRLESFPLQTWENDLKVGLTGSFLCAKYFGNYISQNKNGGSIINISSDLGLIAPDQRLYYQDGVLSELQNVKPVTYSVVKSGLIGLTKYISTYWPDKNVRSNVICPGGVENGQSEDFINQVSNRIPLGRLAKKDEYQSSIVWMLSDSSSYLNGAVIAIDGGRTAW